MPYAHRSAQPAHTCWIGTQHLYGVMCISKKLHVSLTLKTFSNYSHHYVREMGKNFYP